MYWGMIHRYARVLLCAPNISVSWSTLEISVRLVPSNIIKPSSSFLTARSKAVLLWWILFCYLCFVFVIVIVILSRLILAALWSTAGKRLTSCLSCVWCFLSSCHFLVWCPGLSVVFERMIPDLFLHSYFVCTFCGCTHLKNQARGYKTLFMLNSTEHEISTAHKN